MNFGRGQGVRILSLRLANDSLASAVQAKPFVIMRSFNLFASGKAKALQKNVPDHIIRPEYAMSGEPHEASSRKPRVYNEEEIVRARYAGRLARKMLDFANSLAMQPDKYTTNDIDALTREEIIKHGAYPSPLNYRGFPKSICTSVNEVVCHGIPDDRLLKRGDMVSIDISLFIDGFHGDNCGTVISGGASDNEKDCAAERLILATSESLEKAIAVCRPGACISDIGAVIDVVAANYGYSVIHEFCGHGTGELLHMPPFVRHFKNNFAVSMEPGMIFTIEPIFVEGSRRMHVWRDGWSAASLDGGRGAQFEHEVLITEDGHEILTIPE
jgi:methionyl aminopeptidase